MVRTIVVEGVVPIRWVRSINRHIERWRQHVIGNAHAAKAVRLASCRVGHMEPYGAGRVILEIVNSRVGDHIDEVSK